MKTLLLILLLASVAIAQSIEYGKPSDLKGVRRIFVDTGTDLNDRERIIKEIKKAKLDVEILSSPDGAELILSFTSEKSKEIADIKTSKPIVEGFPARSRVTYEEVESGKGAAYVPLPNRRRVLFSWEKEGSASNFASAFIKEFKKANGLK